MSINAAQANTNSAAPGTIFKIIIASYESLLTKSPPKQNAAAAANKRIPIGTMVVTIGMINWESIVCDSWSLSSLNFLLFTPMAPSRMSLMSVANCLALPLHNHW